MAVPSCAVPKTVRGLLDDLEGAKHARPSRRRVESLFDRLARARIHSAESLIRYHEAALFLRAYPQTHGVLSRAEKALASIPARVALLERGGEDLSDFDRPEVSGIAGTSITTDYSYDVVRWLAARHPRDVSIDWEGFEGTDRLRALWPDFLPLLEEEALEDANVPYSDWLKAGKRRSLGDLAWLLARIARLPVSDKERAERFDAVGASVSWKLDQSRSTRTGMRRASRTIFFQDAPLLTRRSVRLEAELTSPRFSFDRLTGASAEGALVMIREATALRYREYYGFTYADPASVERVSAERGLEILFCGLPLARRLPLRAGFAAFLVKNGVPVGYVEALAFFERVEIGFNIYYTFREGESAWIFGQVLKLLYERLGVSSFSIDPYQIGHENKEALDSGAFWFYRKLGFRSTDPKLRRLTDREEKKLAGNPRYRTPPSILKRLATANVLLEARDIHTSLSAGYSQFSTSAWDLFHIRNLGLAVNRRMAARYGGDAEKIRRAATRRVSRILRIEAETWPADRKTAFTSLALVFDLIPDLPRWSPAEKDLLAAVVRAKSGRDESRYLRLMQRHERLRNALLLLGSG
jgi:hypothetical protein